MLIGACDPMSWPIRGFRAFLWKRVMGGKVFNATATVPDLDPDVRVYVTTSPHANIPILTLWLDRVSFRVPSPILLAS